MKRTIEDLEESFLREEQMVSWAGNKRAHFLCDLKENGGKVVRVPRVKEHPALDHRKSNGEGDPTIILQEV
jgi:hypothetical protein